MTNAQYCPICDRQVPANPRYHDYLCRGCADEVHDSEGRPLEFFNTDFSGGLSARYADTGEPYPHAACVVRGHLCYASEARFGGVVIRPKKPESDAR